MTRFDGIRLVALLPLALAALAPLTAQAQQAHKAQPADETWEIRVYPVADLVLARPDYPYRGNEIPTTGRQISPGQPGGPGGFGGFGGGFGSGGGLGGGGGFGGGSGGGFFQIGPNQSTGAEGELGGTGYGGFGIPPETPRDSHRFSIDDLIEAIQATVEPSSWDTLGGDGVCTPLGGLLIVKQTASAQKQIEDLLRAIRAFGVQLHSVTVQAYWAPIAAADLARLHAADQAAEPGLTIVDRAALKTLVEEGFQGRITCYSDQLVHLVSGRRRLAVVGAIPVVGTNTTGYQPVVAMPNVGVLLEIKPTLLPESNSAVVNLTSTVTFAPESAEKIEFQSADSSAQTGKSAGGVRRLDLDRVNLETQQLATTVHVPIGQPVLVGGLSAPKGTSHFALPLSLIVELTINKPPK